MPISFILSLHILSEHLSLKSQHMTLIKSWDQLNESGNLYTSISFIYWHTLYFIRLHSKPKMLLKWLACFVSLCHNLIFCFHFPTRLFPDHSTLSLLTCVSTYPSLSLSLSLISSVILFAKVCTYLIIKHSPLILNLCITVRHTYVYSQHNNFLRLSTGLY